MVIYFALTYNSKYIGIIRFSKTSPGLTLHITNVSSLALPFQCRKGIQLPPTSSLAKNGHENQYTVNIKYFSPNVYKSFEIISLPAPQDRQFGF